MFEDKNRIDKLQKKLYSRNYENPDSTERSGFEDNQKDIPKNWNAEDGQKLEELLQRQREEHEEGVLFKKILIGAIVFFVLALGVAGFMFFGSSSRISSGNIDIQVGAPTSIAGGEELSMEIIIKNRNATSLEGVNLQIEYPEGSRVAGNVTEELLRQRESVGSIPAGGEVRKTVKGVLFGEKDSIKEINIILEYRLTGSSALFFKEKKYEVAIKSSPVIMTVSYPNEVTSGQEVEFVFSISSNTTETLRNVLVRAEYPFGFSFTSSDPQPAEGDYVWRIGDLSPSDRRTIKVRGTLQGQNEEERTFRFGIGLEGQVPNIIAPEFATLSESIIIKKPFLDLAISLAGNSTQEYVSRLGERVQVNVVWTNNLTAPVLNAKLEARISGQAFDRSSVSILGTGFYRSSDNTIIWQSPASPEFGRIEPGQKGVSSFSFTSLPSLPSSLFNQEINVEFFMTGEQVLEGGRPQTISSSAVRKVKLGSNLSLAGRIVRSIGPFENSGPIPPRADTPTTYTVVWSASNSLNDVQNARVEAVLPSYVSWVELTSPSSERITFNPTTRQVVWAIGDIKAGTGIGTAPREVSFQISLTPSLNQVGTSPTLVQEMRITGTDTFTNRNLDSTRPAMTTRINTDPSFKQGDEIVGN